MPFLNSLNIFLGRSFLEVKISLPTVLSSKIPAVFGHNSLRDNTAGRTAFFTFKIFVAMQKSSLLLLCWVAFLGLSKAQVIVDPNPTVVVSAGCENPAVVSLDVTTTPLAGGSVKVTVKAVVKNIGGSAYLSNPGQQALNIYKNGTLLCSQPFEYLAKGASFGKTCEFTVKKLTAAQTFSIKAIIAYDPDILLDANPNNDDCNNADNSKVKLVTI